jgi:opacity protein-like surface antigen
MRGLMLMRVALIALAIPLPANAADLSIPAYKIPAPITDWTGAYLGVYGGASGATGSSFDLGGWLVGGTTGYNWQNGTFVFGIEGDGGWAGLGGTTNCLAAMFTCKTRDSWKRRSSRLRARLNRVPMYFSNIASVASDSRFARQGPMSRSFERRARRPPHARPPDPHLTPARTCQ